MTTWTSGRISLMRFERLLAAHPGHLAVEEHDVDLAIVSHQLEGVVAALDIERFVSSQLESLGERGPELVLVVDESRAWA